MKKILAAPLLVICGLLACTGINAAASDAKYSDNTYDYELYSNADGTKSAEIAYCESSENVISVPDSLAADGEVYKIRSLGEYSFSFVSAAEVKLPEGIENIGKSAFYECGTIESVSIPESVADIGEWAFGGCVSLKNVIVSAGTRIGEWAFCDCASLKCADLSGVTSLGDNAFNGCENLASVFMSSDMDTIGADAFYGCYNLTDVYFMGTQSDWDSVKIGNDNEYLKKANVHFVNGKTKDAAILQKYITNGYSAQNIDTSAFDINKDNNINVFDAILLRRSLM